MIYKQQRCLKNTEHSKIWLIESENGTAKSVLKEYHGDFPAELFARLMKIDQPSIARVISAESANGGYTVTEEYIEGCSLQELLDGGKKFSDGEMKNIAVSLCKALFTLHEGGIIYRDLKPANIMMTENGSIKVIDFNAARIFSQERLRDTRYLGTVGYAAPEQYGFGQTDRRSDIYALGATLYQLHTGSLPAKKSVYSGPMQKIIRKCLEFDPENRYDNVSQVLRDIKNDRGIRPVAVAASVITVAMLAALTLLFGGAGTKPISLGASLVSQSQSAEPSSQARTFLSSEQEYELIERDEPPMISERVFSGKPISLAVITEDFPKLREVPLTSEGFWQLTADPRVEKQLRAALGEKYDLIASRDNIGSPFYCSYDEANGIYFAEFSFAAWQLTQYGAVRIGYVNLYSGDTPISRDVWEFTNTMNQQPGEEIQKWLSEQDDLKSQWENVQQQMQQAAEVD